MGATDNRETVRLFFEGDRSVDRLSLLSETCVWWNGLGRLPGAEGRTEFAGRDEIGEFLLARGGHHRLSTGEVVDRYDLTTARFTDVVTISDGDFVFRQHTYTAKTMGGATTRTPTDSSCTSATTGSSTASGSTGARSPPGTRSS